MSSRKSETSTVGIVLTALAFAGLLLFAIIAFLALVMTVLCVFAWRKPLQMGRWTLEPAEAHAFVRSGLIGAAMLPAFVAFCDLIFVLHVDWSYLLAIMGSGYVAASMGWAVIAARSGEVEPSPPQSIAPPEARAVPVEDDNDRPPFRFATWDDEEERQE